ncbi:UTRA domain-containing protein [Janthinobacterium psychrotolerans]|uniref:UTRA domain-containing protein n=1 Tax=Janthinobacterium psychrotolerans TaxID=1747903 RepID=A0A1A7C4U1_9BURK|nr:UTRA domain-containing protein [Janthinobacterium psychrotolerans]
MRTRGRTPRSVWLKRSEGTVTPEEALRLRLRPGAPVYRFQRIGYADELPMCLEYATIAAGCLPSLASVDLSGTGRQPPGAGLAAPPDDWLAPRVSITARRSMARPSLRMTWRRRGGAAGSPRRYAWRPATGRCRRSTGCGCRRWCSTRMRRRYGYWRKRDLNARARCARGAGRRPVAHLARR